MGNDPECAKCEGEGFVKMPRCPTYTTQSISREVREAFRAFRLFRDHGILPAAGGFYDQCASFLFAFELCEATGRQILAREHDHVERMRKLKQRGIH